MQEGILVAKEKREISVECKFQKIYSNQRIKKSIIRGDFGVDGRYGVKGVHGDRGFKGERGPASEWADSGDEGTFLLFST